MTREDIAARKRAAEQFARKWSGRGYEKGDTAPYWLELLDTVIGMSDVTTNVRFENQTIDRGYVDVTIRDAKTIIEQKSLGVDLDKPELRQNVMVTPYEQAKRYADSLRNSERPDTIIVCNFEEFRIHDLDSANPALNYERFTLDELPEQLHLLDYLADPQLERRKREEKVSLDAGLLIGKLYDKLRQQYTEPDSDESMHALNILCVRLVFLLFAEDAGLFKKDTFYNYMKKVPAHMARTALQELFHWLNSPSHGEQKYASAALREFPYVNGGLFAAEVEIPNFTDEILDFLLSEVSAGTNWSQISPTVFGGVFESTLNPETRHKGGMHYTSPENIHKLIGPLFLDELKEELDNILSDTSFGETARHNRLRKFHDKIANMTFLDPACGSGNFLTETYIQLRKLENKILSELQRNQGMFSFNEDLSPLKISLQQFHGIEINDFAVNVAKTALWIAELQANAEAQSIAYGIIQDFPLQDSANIVHGNALRIDWGDIVSPSELTYIIGNPPFLGARYQSKSQKSDIREIFGNAKNSGNVDYVAGWYMKAAQFIDTYPIQCAFVGTNSICQGEQVANIWSPIYELGVRIDFAHTTFRWVSESKGQASVFVVIVAFSKLNLRKTLFHYPSVDGEPIKSHPSRLNAYLTDGPDIFIWDRSKPICSVPVMTIGSQPIDKGNFLFTTKEKNDFLSIEPSAEKYFKRWYGSREFIRGIERWALWLGAASQSDLLGLPECMKRVEAVRAYRRDSDRPQTQQAAQRPQHFGTEIIHSGSAIIIPEVSSQSRRYIPMGFIGPDSLCSNKLKLIPDGTLFHFGILQSIVHNAWIRAVAGRLKSDYSYSSGIVYNNFIWPDVTEAEKEDIYDNAQLVLDRRLAYPDSTLAQMYDPKHAWMYSELMDAHRSLDAAVLRAYGLNVDCHEEDILTHLFDLYSNANASG